MPPNQSPRAQSPRADGSRVCFAFPLNFTSAAGFQLAANAGTQQLNISGNPGQNFHFVNIGLVSTGPFLVQLIMTRLGGGLFNEAISSETILAPLNMPYVLPFPISVYGSENIQVQLTNDNGAVANDVRLTFWGFKDYLGVGCND